MVESQALGPSLIKQLASCNKTTRDKALRILLNKWLPSQQQISHGDMKKLWKGLFYCLWHADKALVQSELIDDLSSLLLLLDLSLSVRYFSVFLLTIRREWPGIDGLRLDKFYLLIRRFVRCFFLLMKKNNWDVEISDRLMGILEERAFFADDKFQGNGVNYHIASVFVDELKGFLPVHVETLEVMFKRFLAVMCKSNDRVLVGKIKYNVFDVLLKMGKILLEKKKVDDVGDVEDEVVNLGTIALRMGFSAKFFDLGSSPDCYQGNRKVLYGLHEEFMKLEKDLELSGVEISLPLVKVDDEEEVPKLIPIVSIVGGEIEASASEVVPEATNKGSKKKKRKAKKGSDRSKENGISLKDEKENENENVKVKVITANGESSNDEPTSEGGVLTFNESVISNLQMQFEKVAAEIGLENDVTGSIDTPEISIEDTTISKKKRKRARSTGRNPDNSGQVDAGKSTEKSAKKVRFSIKNNLVWKPQSPLPPQSLRLPPSVTPRGSALKKGIPPGPIREMPPANKTLKQKKKGRKGIKTISPGIKRLWKLQTLSL